MKEELKPKIASIDIDETIAKRLKELRRARGMTQQDCSRKINAALGVWQNYEATVRSVSIEKLFLIADTFDVSISYLLGFSDQENGESRYYNVTPGADIALNRQTLRDKKIRPKCLIEVKAKDDAMLPTIKRGDIVVINTENKQYDRAVNLFAINHPTLGVVIRGIRPEINGTYTLFVTNRGEHDDLTVSEDELNNIDIVGSYVGHWQWSKN